MKHNLSLHFLDVLLLVLISAHIERFKVFCEQIFFGTYPEQIAYAVTEIFFFLYQLL